jgi:hypothetical protein
MSGLKLRSEGQMRPSEDDRHLGKRIQPKKFIDVHNTRPRINPDPDSYRDYRDGVTIT